jgi:hypothetical protein
MPAAADALIGALLIPPAGGESLPPSTVNAVAQGLDRCNNWLAGIPHCDSTPSSGATCGRIKATYR